MNIKATLNGSLVRMYINDVMIQNECKSTIDFSTFNLAYVTMLYSEDMVVWLKDLINKPISMKLTNNDGDDINEPCTLYNGEAIILKVKIEAQQNESVKAFVLIELITHDDR